MNNKFPTEDFRAIYALREFIKIFKEDAGYAKYINSKKKLYNLMYPMMTLLLTNSYFREEFLDLGGEYLGYLHDKTLVIDKDGNCILKDKKNI